jgi:hypothetical protein
LGSLPPLARPAAMIESTSSRESRLSPMLVCAWVFGSMICLSVKVAKYSLVSTMKKTFSSHTMQAAFSSVNNGLMPAPRAV